MMYTNHTLGKLLTIIILFLGGQNLFSATIPVCSTCTHTSITTAIGAASSGDIIDIQYVVPYTEDNITVNKNLTIQGQGQNTTIIQAHATPGMATDRVFNVTSGLTVTFQDMTIRHGRVTGTDDGGGVRIVCNAMTDINFNRVAIDNNEAGDDGGGVYVFTSADNGRINFTDCVISNNSASDDGGGIYASSGNTINFTDCVVNNNNSGGQGGGMRLNNDPNTNLTFNNTIVHNNECASEGGGIILEGDDGTATFNNCVFHDNEADITNGNADGGAIFNNGATTFNMNSCSIYDNQSGGGAGGIDLSHPGATSIFTNCTIAGNTIVDDEGGGVNIDDGDATFINCTIVNNSISDPDDGGGIYMNNTASSLTLTNTIVANNTSNGLSNDVHLRNNTLTHTFSTNLIEDCTNCTATYNTDPNLAAQATCGNHIYYEPQSPSDALDNAAAPGGVVPATDICGVARTGGPNTLGSFFVAPPPVVVIGGGGGGASIPTVSEWGMILLILMMITLQLATSKMLCLGENAVSGSLNFRLLPFDAPAFLRYSLLVLSILVALFTLAIALFGYTLTSADPVGSVLSAVVLGYLFMLLQAE